MREITQITNKMFFQTPVSAIWRISTLVLPFSLFLLYLDVMYVCMYVCLKDFMCLDGSIDISKMLCVNHTQIHHTKEKIATGVLMAKWDFGTKWTVKPLVVL